uniref:Uncharacterized protein n=1 Tax=Rhizophora mucronata TaxID=61149 RepID=A0A2P2J475_RHIMU
MISSLGFLHDSSSVELLSEFPFIAILLLSLLLLLQLSDFLFLD